MTTTSTNDNADDRFGICPHCGKTDGYVNVGRGHWFFCIEHRVKWYAGSNLFSSWHDETEEEQRRVFDEIGLGFFENDGPYSHADLTNIVSVAFGAEQDEIPF